MSESDAVKNDPQAAPPGNGELFLGFLMLGLIGFGGVLPLARNMLWKIAAGSVVSSLPSCWGCASFCRVAT